MVKVNHLVARAPSRGVYSAIFHNKYLEILKLYWNTPGKLLEFFFIQTSGNTVILRILQLLQHAGMSVDSVFRCPLRPVC